MRLDSGSGLAAVRASLDAPLLIHSSPRCPINQGFGTDWPAPTDSSVTSGAVERSEAHLPKRRKMRKVGLAPLDRTRRVFLDRPGAVLVRIARTEEKGDWLAALVVALTPRNSPPAVFLSPFSGQGGRFKGDRLTPCGSLSYRGGRRLPDPGRRRGDWPKRSSSGRIFFDKSSRERQDPVRCRFFATGWKSPLSSGPTAP